MSEIQFSIYLKEPILSCFKENNNNQIEKKIERNEEGKKGRKEFMPRQQMKNKLKCHV